MIKFRGNTDDRKSITLPGDFSVTQWADRAQHWLTGAQPRVFPRKPTPPRPLLPLVGVQKGNPCVDLINIYSNMYMLYNLTSRQFFNIV